MQGGNVGGPCWDSISGLLSPVEGSPLWLLLEQAHGLEVVVDIQCEAVVDPGRLVGRRGKKEKRKNEEAMPRREAQKQRRWSSKAPNQNEEISWAHGDADPPVGLVPDIKVP